MTTKTKPKEYKAPFLNGNLQQYAYGYSAGQYDWRENVPFKKLLTLDSLYSGRSAKGVIWRDMDGNTYPMFVTDLIELINLHELAYGKVLAYWVVQKRGENYGLRFHHSEVNP
jgi:ABC-type phosphate transport system auxiliary subunit